MPQNLRKIIDSIDERTTREDLEKKIALLQNTNLKLKIRVQELEELLEEYQNQMSNFKEDLPSDYQVLKDIIRDQRKEMYEKDKQINILRELAQKFTSDLEQTHLKGKALEFKLIDIPGIGIKTQQMLQKAGISDITDLINCEIEDLARSTKGLGITRLRDWKMYLVQRNEKIRNI